MKNLKTLKNRVRVVKNTKQITKALQMVSVSKMQKAQEMLEKSLAYSDAVLSFIRDLAVISHNFDVDSSKIYFEPVNKSAPELVVIFAPTRGFCGALVSTLRAFVYEFTKREKKGTLRAVGLQRKSRYILQSLDDDIVDAIFEDPLDEVSKAGIQAEYEFMINGYKEGKYSRVVLIYPKFKTIFSYEPVAEQLLPLDKTMFEIGNHNEGNKEQNPTIENAENVFEVEPSAEVFFREALERYLENRLVFAALNTKASEFSARTLAMKNATDNAERLEEALQLEFNKVRQESITNELLDIVGALPKDNL